MAATIPAIQAADHSPRYVVAGLTPDHHLRADRLRKVNGRYVNYKM